MVSRHDQEVADLAEQIKVLMKGAKKATKAQVEAQCIQMQFDLKAKHRDEIDDWEEKNGGVIPEVKPIVSATSEQKETRRKEEEVEKKAARAKKKADKKHEKEKQKEEIKKEIEIKSAGQSLKEREDAIILNLVARDGYYVKPILSDGHCLYR